MNQNVNQKNPHRNAIFATDGENLTNLKADYNRLKSRSSTIDLRSIRKIDLFKENLPFVGGLGGGFLLALGK